MAQKNDGGPAFPQNDAAVNRVNNEAGMTLRDYFAAKAMAALIVGYDSEMKARAVKEGVFERTGFDDHPWDSENSYAHSAASEAVLLADELLKALDK